MYPPRNHDPRSAFITAVTEVLEESLDGDIEMLGCFVCAGHDLSPDPFHQAPPDAAGTGPPRTAGPRTAGQPAARIMSTALQVHGL